MLGDNKELRWKMTKDWKYIRYINVESEAEEMSNLPTDPVEMKNLINDKDFINMKNELKKRYKYYMSTINILPK